MRLVIGATHVTVEKAVRFGTLILLSVSDKSDKQAIREALERSERLHPDE